MQLKNKKIFISGGSGVIGREIVPLLIEEGAELMVGDLQFKPNEFSSKIHYRQGDLNYLSQKEIDLFNPEIFIHLAATFERSTESYEHWEENFWHNIRLSHHLMSLIRNVPNIKRVVNASSYLIYDKSLYQFKKSKNKPIKLKESDPINPRNLTGLAKLAHEIEHDFLALFKSEKFTSISARIYRGYGKNSRDVISRWVRDLINNKEITVYNKEGIFDYMYAEDTAKGLIHLSKIKNTGVVNLGTGRSRKVEDIIDILKIYFPELKAKYINKPGEFIEASEADTTKLKQIIGWLPERFLEDTIPELIDFEKKLIKSEISYGNVLITSASKKIPLIQSVNESVSKVNDKIKVFSGDIDNNCLAKFFTDDFLLMPRLEKIKITDLISLCKEREISLIIPTRDGELEFFAKNKKILFKNNINVMVSDEHSIINCIDKLKFSQIDSIKEYTIPTFEKIELTNFNKFVVKERFGAGSFSIGVNLSRNDAIRHSMTLNHPIFQPYIVGKEISVDAYVDKNKNVKGLIMRRRNYIINGESQITTTFNNASLEKKFANIIKKLNLYGHVILQAFIDENNKIYLIECNARFGGASTLSIKSGLDSFYWTYLEAHNIDISNYSFIKSNETIKQIRYPRDLYI